MNIVKYYFFLIKDSISHEIEKISLKYPNFKKKFVKWTVIILALLIAAIAVKLIFFKKAAQELKAEEMIQVKTQKVAVQDYTDSYTVMGTIKGAVENDIRFEVEGQLAKFNFKEGARVSQGQIIASLDPKDYMTRADYAQSRYRSELSAFHSAKERYKVYEELFNMKALSESKLFEARFEIQSAESRVKAAMSELELAQSNLAKTSLAAPAAGILAEIIIKPGEYVTPQDVVLKYISDKGTNFEVDVPEKDVQRLKTGMAVKITVDSYPGKEFLGTLTDIAPTVRERTRTTTIKIDVDNAEGLLRSGMFGRGIIILKEYKDVVLVPTDSVVSLNETTFLVPVVAPDGTTPGEGLILMRPVQTGDKLSNDKTVILQGLALGELVVSETQGQLSDGIRVKFTETVEETAVPF